jgi:predicted ATPase/DNA-binding SARP family transcriptional activator
MVPGAGSGSETVLSSGRGFREGAAIDILLLGPLEVRVDGTPLRLGGPKQRALLALLALEANDFVPRERAIDALWGERPPERAVNALQVQVHSLRRLLGGEAVATHGNAYALRVDPRTVDALRFGELVDGARRRLLGGAYAAALGSIDRALALWRGPMLADLPQELLAAERRSLHEARRGAIELAIDAKLALGEHEAALPQIEALIAEEPFREGPRRQLMLALYRSGRQADALDVYRETRRVLDEELGISPGPELGELQRAILRQDASLAAPRGGSRLVRLPRPRTPLVGRAEDVAAVGAAVTGDAPIVTVTGIGGVGKTRVAVEAAWRASGDFRDGALFVDLASTPGARQVPGAIAAALGLPPDQRLATRDAVIAALRGRELLLVLDNFEHVADAAGFVAELLEAAVEVHVVATSRTRLGVVGEREYPLRPLAAPGSDDVVELERNDSATVFVERARALDPSFALSDENAAYIAEICRAADGIPLALELAAAATKLLTPAEIRVQLTRALDLHGPPSTDRPKRQRTLRATLDWSHALLAPEERSLFARVAVFRGGFTLAALDAVCGSELDALATLLDHGLVLREQAVGREPRFRLLKLVHDYALERLDELGDGGVAERHARYYVSLARAFGDELVGPRSPWAAARVAQEHENLMAALEWALDHDMAAGYELVTALRRYWEMAPRGRDVGPWLERALSRPEQPDSRHRSGALVLQGRELIVAGDYDEAERRFAEAREQALRFDSGDAAWACVYLAWLRALHGDHEAAAAFGAEAASLGRGTDPLSERNGLAMQAALHVRRGEHEQARRRLDEALTLSRRLGDASTIVLSMINWSYATIEAGELDAAEAMLEEGLALAETIDEPIRTVGILYLLAVVANERGAHERARAHLVRAIPLARDRGRLLDRLEVLGEMAHALGPIDPERAAVLVAATSAAYEDRGIVRARFATERARSLMEVLDASTDEPVRRALAGGRWTSLATCYELALAPPAKRRRLTVPARQGS